MKMDDALQVLHDLTKFGINLGLERITCLLKHFDNPQDRLEVIHIGGTNGKGSTAAVLSSILKEAGYRVGLYTSPHLSSYTERIMIDGAPIPEGDFAQLLSEMVPIFQAVQKVTGENPTEFEVLTAMAFVYFFRQRTDLVLLEVGLGGDIDSTNVIKTPLVSIITNVSADHLAYLGPGLKEIAQRKSGIIKENCSVVTACKDELALEVIRQTSREKQARLYEVFREMRWEQKEETSEGQEFYLNSAKGDYGLLFCPLRGEHQLVNVATALLALEVINKSGWKTKPENIRDGLARVSWPGRLEVIKRKPLVIIDGAHNPAGMEALAGWLKTRRPNYEKITLVIGMLDDKDRFSAVSALDQMVDKIIITKPASPRAGNWQELGQYFSKKEGRSLNYQMSPAAALEDALSEAQANEMILVTGSLYMLGEARKHLMSS